MLRLALVLCFSIQLLQLNPLDVMQAITRSPFDPQSGQLLFALSTFQLSTPPFSVSQIHVTDVITQCMLLLSLTPSDMLQVLPPTSPSPGPSAAATDEEQGGIKRARQRKRKEPEVVDERTARMQKRMVSLSVSQKTHCVSYAVTNNNNNIYICFAIISVTAGHNALNQILKARTQVCLQLTHASKPEKTQLGCQLETVIKALHEYQL